jgi:hypothetical protein
MYRTSLFQVSEEEKEVRGDMPSHCMIFIEALCLVSSYSAYTATPRLLAAALVINHSIIFALKGDRQEARAV